MSKRIPSAALALAASLSVPALADDSQPSAATGATAAHRLGDHPAVVVARLEKEKGYDYASKFYPHPARLEVVETPHPLGDHPAVIVARMQKDKGYDYAAQFYLHPARLAMLPEAPPEASATTLVASKSTRKLFTASGVSANAAPRAPSASAPTSATTLAASATPTRK